MEFRDHVARGDEEAVTRLLDAHPTLLEAQEYGFGSKPLELAATCRQLGMVRLLVQRGANVNLSGGPRRMTALHCAVWRGHEEMVAFLLGNGAQASLDSNGTTPFMLASQWGHLGVVRMLFEHQGQQVLAERGEQLGWTALHCGTFWIRAEVARFLLLAGADPTIRDSYGRTPRALAEEKRDMWPTLVEIFESWEGELKRRPLLERARRFYDASTTQRDAPTAPVPAFLQARAAAGQALPQVEVVAAQQEEQQAGASGKRGASSEAGRTQEEEERHAVCGFVVRQLNEGLFTELLQGFHAPKMSEREGSNRVGTPVRLSEEEEERG